PTLYRSQLYYYSSSPPHSSPTLVPYTTLFRSPAKWRQTMEDRDSKTAKLPSSCNPSRWKTWGRRRPEPSRAGRKISEHLWDQVQDRKSTRLNSSHVKSSYAVFCLKKKTDGTGS